VGCGLQESENTNQHERNNMTKQSSKLIALTAMFGLIASSLGCRSYHYCFRNASDSTSNRNDIKIHSDFPLDDQVVDLHKEVTFTISGTFKSEAGHQWFFNGSPITAESAPALGVTGYESNMLKITSASLTNCGFYSYENEPMDDRDGKKRKVSQTAELQIVYHPVVSPRMLGARSLQTVTVVYGTPIAGGGGNGTGCPGPYCGYANYSVSCPFTNGGQAYVTDNPGNAVVYHYGVPATNWGCGSNILPSPYPYRFKVFFKTSVPTGPYALTLVPN
jgi:hypothetical protein